MDSTASFLLESLQSKTLAHDLYTQFSNYLKPITSLKQKHLPAGSDPIRPLAKKFLSFLCKLVSLLRSLLHKKPNCGANQERERDETLLVIFKLTIDCINSLSPCLVGKSYEVHLIRVSFVSCLETCEKYEQAEKEAALVLKDLVSVLVPAKTAVTDLDAKWTVPDPKTVGSNDSEITTMFMKIIVCFANCAYKTKSKSFDCYRRIIKLVEQVQPWIQILDKEASRNNRLYIKNALYGCTSFLSSEFKSFDLDLVKDFCFMFLKECSKISIEQLAISARRMCYKIENCDSLFLNVTEASLELFLCEYKVETMENLDEFLKFVAYSFCTLCDTDSNKCKAASTIFKRHINVFDKVSPPFASILSLYSLSLDLKSNTPFGQIDNETKANEFSTVFKDRDLLQKLSKSVETVSSYTYTCENGSKISFSEKKGRKNASISALSYLDALQYVCEVLIPCIDAIWPHFCSEKKLLFDKSNMSHILQVINKFTSSTIHSLRIQDLSETEKIALSKSDKRNLLLKAVSSELRICFLTDTPYELHSISNLLSSDWSTTQELKYIIATLSNTGCEIYNMGQFDKATVALQLCFEATFANIEKCCAEKSKDNFAPNAVTKDLHGFQSCFVIVKTWVKMLCREYDDGEKRDDAPILYKLLSKYIPSWSKKNLGRFLEQELLAYALLEPQFPDFCIKMQEKVSKVLLNDLYIADEYPVERSRVLVRKARFIRAGGIEKLKDCVDCLSDAIFLLKGVTPNCSKVDALICHQLASTYCLHAQCLQEANLDFEEMLQDIESALHFWSGINIEHYSHEHFGSETVSKDMLVMLCSMLDLLSIKGCFKLHYEICKLMAELFKQVNLPLDKLFALLWTNRRLGHSICRSEIDLHDLSHSITEFSLDCLKTENPSLCLFLQSLFSNHLACQKMGNNHFEKLFGCQKMEDLRSIASSLASKADTLSLFFAGYVYYDLSQWLLSEGELIEAIYCARESRQLRTRVLKRKFIYSENHKKPEELHLEAKGTNMTEIWPDLNRRADSADSFLSPWIVLRSFLESTSQLGSMCELAGNVSEAEALLSIGKEISRINALRSFGIIFSSSLGQIYRKRKLLDLAEAELKTAKTLFEKTDKIISCNSCAILIKTTINLLEGDLSRSNNLEHALSTYKSALENLDHFEMKHPNIESCKIGAILNQKTSSNSSLKDKETTKNKNVLKDVNLESKPVRMTRSRFAALSIKGQSENVEIKNEIVVEPKRTRKKTGRNEEVVCEKAVCLSCLVRKTVHCKTVASLLHLGFEFRKRRFVLLLRLKIARLMVAQGGKLHEIHEMFWKCISILSCKSSEIQGNQLNELLIDEDFGKAFCIERALILYNMGFILLKHRQLKKSRSKCCSLSNSDTSVAITWLLRAFILSQEFPLLLTKVSRLLACTFVLSKLDTSIFLPLNSEKCISVNQWASFFHQASVGASLDLQYLCALNQASKGEDGETVTKTAKNTSKFRKYSFERIEQLEDHVAHFFKKLPSVPIICMSMLGDDYANFLGETLILPPFPPAWIILSRINSTNQPITMLLPINPITDVKKEERDCSKESSEIKEGELKIWNCPWDRSVLDEVAPSFKLLMENNYLSMSKSLSNKKKFDKDNYWQRRFEINYQMQQFLKNLEELWLGPWSCLLKGELINKVSLSSKNDILAKAVLCGAKSLDEGKACHSQIVSYGGHLGHGVSCEKDKLRFRVFSSSCEFDSELLKSLPKLIEEREKEVSSDPVIFVLDTDIQMLPWENLPSLRDQEVYRMPSVGSVFLTLDRNLNKKCDDFFPKVNLSDAYYLVNPGGDLTHTQGEFEPLCKKLNWEGKAGKAPTSEELCTALKNHDMFLYFGHGSGSRYISGKQIEKLNGCAASFLMGCSSGSLICRGIYAPEGISLSYLFAGSPAIIGNLWDVTDRDIDLFGKAVLDSWLHSCELVGSSRNLSEGKRESGLSRIASCMGKAREKCKLGTLIGAAPVCYGVPTILARGNGD
ncbi:hypothetical protein LUZ60_000265 [Juncus effusus]|nr:hypothetical protein LUZ60_000265 [Juncus effusus]